MQKNEEKQEKKAEIKEMITNGGIIVPIIATSVPARPASLYPTTIAPFTAIGPGVISAIVIRFVNSLMESQLCRFTTCSCISGIAAYHPPKLNAPT